MTSGQRIARFNRRLDQLLASSSRRRTALNEKKQDPNKTMMGGWGEDDRREAVDMIEQFQGVVDGLATYLKGVKPDSIKQIGQLVGFVSKVKQPVGRLVELLKNFS